MEGYISYFEFTKVLKNFSECQNDESPEDYKGPYGEFGRYVNGIKFKDWSLKSSELQILKFENDKNYPFLLKRIVTPCSLSRDSFFTYPQIRNFLMKGYNEYVISKLVSGHPNGVNSYDFSIIRITNQNLLIMEFLMDDLGPNIKKNIFPLMKTPQKVIDILTQSANILAYLESFQIFFNDLTLENFLLDKFGYFKFISYEVVQFNKRLVKIKSGESMLNVEFSDGYASPELLRIFNTPQNADKEESTFNIWKSNVYAWGMMALLLLGGIPDFMTFQQMDNTKNENAHQKLLQLINIINLNDEFTENFSEIIKFILNSCLEYDPAKRISFPIIYKTLSQLKGESIGTVKEEINKLIKNQAKKNSNNNLIVNNLEQELEIAVQERNVLLLQIENINKSLYEHKSKLSEYENIIITNQQNVKSKEQQISQLQKTVTDNGTKIQNLENSCKVYIQDIERLNNVMSSLNNENGKLRNYKNALEEIIKIFNEKMNYQFISVDNLKDIPTKIADNIINTQELYHSINLIFRNWRVKPPSAIKTPAEIYNLICGLVEKVNDLTFQNNMHPKNWMIPGNNVAKSAVQADNNFIIDPYTGVKEEIKREL